LITFNSTSAWTLVLRTFLTTSSLIIASQTKDFPRPSIQFTAADFLSEQKLPVSLHRIGYHSSREFYNHIMLIDKWLCCCCIMLTDTNSTVLKKKKKTESCSFYFSRLS
jgi:hypothetical protein